MSGDRLNVFPSRMWVMFNNLYLCPYSTVELRATWRFILYFFHVDRISDEVYQLLAQGRWFSPGTPASSTTKTGRHDIAEILLKVVLNTKIQIQCRSSIHYLRLAFPKIFPALYLQTSKQFLRNSNLNEISLST
jgi:hypothetical protein